MRDHGWYVVFIDDGNVKVVQRELPPRGEHVREYAGPYETESEARAICEEVS